jgi:mannose-1-phosphate guanylyltransferase
VKRQALLLAAGRGTRLRPLTDILPKCLAPICGRPLLGYWLSALAESRFEKILVNLHHHADLVRRYVENGPFAGKVELVAEKELLGTGGTLFANRQRFDRAPILVAHADNLSLFDPVELLAHHARRPPGCVMTAMTFETDDPQSCGIVETDDRGVIIGFHEKVASPPGRLANAAVYVFEPTIFDELAAVGSPFIDISTEIIPCMMGRAYTFENTLLHRDVGTMKSLATAQSELQLHISPQQLAAASTRDTAWKNLLASGNPSLGMMVTNTMRALPS